ncbi:hypothetical protein PUR59_01465 [Streptomyces sp. SP18ES09]|uniref:hypothetical protein n=1 Tax=Streptomyces sp. SP18ES09 TaxID=3002532 RepID=UPI002E7A809E|nr:hypothetical protein [Streptomyces sp. SP18ES09]MEE1813709.1 hypothetical protein [Streptomyces sp. SP18ES09]
MAIAVPRTWVVGEVVTAAYLNAEIRDQWLDMLAAWVTYTPVWTAATTNPVLGNGTIVGRYKKVGRKVDFQIDLTMGSTTTYGTGAWSVTLPFTAAGSSGSRIGTAQALGASRFAGQVVISSGANGTSAFFPASSSVSNLSSAASAVPFAWASGNELRITGTYESAT